MSSQPETIDYLTRQMSGAGMIRARKMFGEYAIYCDNKVVALVCDDQLFLKPTEMAKDYLTEIIEAPPYPGAKNYWQIPEDNWDDEEWLTELIRLTAKALPIPKLKNTARKKQARG